MIMSQMFTIYPPSQDPSRLCLEPKDSKLAATFAGVSLAFSLIAWHFLLIDTATVAGKEDLLETSVVTFGPADYEGIAVS
jgi:hypothetical protein